MVFIDRPTDEGFEIGSESVQPFGKIQGVIPRRFRVTDDLVVSIYIGRGGSTHAGGRAWRTSHDGLDFWFSTDIRAGGLPQHPKEYPGQNHGTEYRFVRIRVWT